MRALGMKKKNMILKQRREPSNIGFGNHIGVELKEVTHVVTEEIRDSTNRLTGGIFQEINE